MSDIFGGNAFLPTLFILADLIAGKAALPAAKATDILETLAENESYAVVMDRWHTDLPDRGLARFLNLPAPGDITRP